MEGRVRGGVEGSVGRGEGRVGRGVEGNAGRGIESGVEGVGRGVEGRVGGIELIVP